MTVLWVHWDLSGAAIDNSEGHLPRQERAWWGRRVPLFKRRTLHMCLEQGTRDSQAPYVPPPNKDSFIRSSQFGMAGATD